MTRRLPLDHETGRARRRLEEPRTRLDLFVNERLIYYRVLSASQQWLDDEYYGYDSRTVMIYGTTLRASSTWQAWDAGGRPRVLSEEESRGGAAVVAARGLAIVLATLAFLTGPGINPARADAGAVTARRPAHREGRRHAG